MLTGELIGGRYRLCERINQGSSGVVWRAEELLEKQPIATVAIKVFTVDVNHNEIAALARLQHTHILGYRTVVEHEGRSCLITEFADGGDLAQMLKAYPDGLPPERVAEVVLATAAALRYLHEQSWVHRDVKPSNILYVGATPKLGDVGTAKATGSAMTRHTGVGTIAYSAPEMFSGQVGPASDMYALGVTTLELLTGRLPFEGEAAQVLSQHLHQQPTIPEWIPHTLRTLLLGCLAKHPEQRLQAAGVLDLMQPRATAPLPATVPPPETRAGAVKPEQIVASMTLHIRNHLQRHATGWDSAAVWGPFWQELRQSGQPLGLTDSDLLRQVQALREEMFPLTPTTRPVPPPRPVAAPERPSPQPVQDSVPPPRPPLRPSAASNPAPQAVRQALIELIQTYGGRWSQSEVWQPFWGQLQPKAAGCRERDAIMLGEELERQLAEHDKQRHQLQLQVLQWVAALDSRSWHAKDWLRFLDGLKSQEPSIETLAARYRDEALRRLFPQQTGELWQLRVSKELSLEFVFLGKDALGSAVPLTDLADAVLHREERQSRPGKAPLSARGIWISLVPITMAQWYALLQQPLPARATKPAATARVLQKGILSELLPRLHQRFPLEALRLATRAESHVLRKLITPPAEKDQSAVPKGADQGPASLLGILGLAAAHVLEQVATENQEWFQNDAPPAGDAQSQRKLPFRLVSVVPR